ncbi:DUF6898 family protein [Pedomonas mirosovicensis]|uniref:DUF6898 family protein n=1 Tax=Pedomonas mirosovicensis TaxID=2908641 RepID=UPI002167F93B|nr:hypothetical protein [Pedomonas mirosovicensis]MCH8685463.1 hypothetical protein [Pedomonas mirosovicensis]
MTDETDFEGFFVEFTPVGSSVKVCAIDPLTGLEAVVVGSSHTPSHVLANMAIRKLKASLGQGGEGDTQEPAKTTQHPRRGLIV